MSIVDGGFWDGDMPREDLEMDGVETFSRDEEPTSPAFPSGSLNDSCDPSLLFPSNTSQSTGTGSVLVQPPSNQRSHFTTTNPSTTIATPVSHLDPPNVLMEEYCQFKFPDEQECALPPDQDPGYPLPDTLFWCPFLIHLTSQPRKLDDPYLTNALRTVASRLRPEDIEGYHQSRALQRESTAFQPVPPIDEPSDGSSTTPSRESYLCPNAGDTPQSAPQSKGSRQKFRCPMCTKGFGKKNDLRKHMQARNPPVKYRCSGCKNSYSRLDKFRIHIRKKHPDLPHADNEYLEQAAVPMQQSHPETCLHCPLPLQDFESWFEHWIRIHKATPATRVTFRPNNNSRQQPSFNPRMDAMTPGLEAINRFMQESDHYEGYRVGANNAAHDNHGLQQTVQELDQQARGHY